MVTESAELTHAVLSRITRFVRGLSTQDLADLVAGTARLQLVRGDEPVRGAAGAVRPRGDLPIAPAEVRSFLSSTSDRLEAQRYLDGLHLTLAQLRALAKALNLAVAAGAPKAQVRDTIVQWTVGRRADAAVLSRPAAPSS